MLVRACLIGRYQPLMGPRLFLEYEAVMLRETLFTTCHLTMVEREALLGAFLSQDFARAYLQFPGLQIIARRHCRRNRAWPL
jgi:uncharacterized protein